MSEEIIGGYAALSHEVLYKMLMVGDPGQVDGLASEWSSVQGTVEHLAASLGRDLAALHEVWAAESGTEFQRRVGIVSAYSADLGRDFDALHQGLTLMAGALREARAKAENPADTDDSDSTLSSAATGALVGGAVAGAPGAAVGATIGAVFGHEQDEQEKAKARQRMVQVVTELAGEYEVTGADRWPGAVPEPPADLPSDGTKGAFTATSGPSVNKPAQTPLPGSGVPAESGTADPGLVQNAPTTGVAGHQIDGADGAAPGTGQGGTGLLAAGGSLIGSGALNAAAPGVVLGGSTVSAAGAAGAGVFGGAAGASAFTPQTEAKSTGGAAGAGRGAPVRGSGAAPVEGPGSSRSAAGVGRSGSAGADEPDERLTWLVEDEMVWGDGDAAAPAVLGGAPEQSPAEEHESSE